MASPFGGCHGELTPLCPLPPLLSCQLASVLSNHVHISSPRSSSRSVNLARIGPDLERCSAGYLQCFPSLLASTLIHGRMKGERARLWRRAERERCNLLLKYQMIKNSQAERWAEQSCTEGSSYGRPFQTTLTVRPLNSHSSYFAPSTFKWNRSASACTQLHLTCVTPCVFLYSSPITCKCWAVCLTLWEGPDAGQV